MKIRHLPLSVYLKLHPVNWNLEHHALFTLRYTVLLSLLWALPICLFSLWLPYAFQISSCDIILKAVILRRVKLILQRTHCSSSVSTNLCTLSIHTVVCHTTAPLTLPRLFLHRARSSASCFKFRYPLLSLRSSSSCLRLLLHPVNIIEENNRRLL